MAIPFLSAFLSFSHKESKRQEEGVLPEALTYHFSGRESFKINLFVQKINFNIEVLKEADQFVAVARNLNVSSCGDSPEEAEKSLQEALSLFLEECEKIGSLQEVLEEAGYFFEAGSLKKLI